MGKKKGEVLFFSAEFSGPWELPLEPTFLMTVPGCSVCQFWAFCEILGANHYQKLSSGGFQQPVLSAKRPTLCICLHRTWLQAGGAHLPSKAGLLVWSPGLSQQMSLGSVSSASARLSC